MNSGVPAKLIATTFALCGFAVAVVAGLAAGNPSTRVLFTALVSMVICQVLGAAAGAIGERIVHEHVSTYRAGRPVPEFRSAPPIADGASQAGKA